MVNLKGFRDLVDAVGGVTLNVRQRIPIGGLGSDVYDYIEPGKQKLTGFQTQWYARARDGSDDYSRMARQKCVMAAMLDQLEPTDVLKNFQKIAKASSAMVSTSIPASEVDRFIGLALKARDQKVSTLSIVPPIFDTYEPDAKLIRQKVAEAIDTAEGNAPKAADAESDAAGQAGQEQEAEAARRRHRWLGRLAQRGVRRQRVPGPRQRLLRQSARRPSVRRCADLGWTQCPPRPCSPSTATRCCTGPSTRRRARCTARPTVRRGGRCAGC